MSIASTSPALDTALLDNLDTQVRAAVRRDGVDPQREVHLVRSIAEQLVRAHDERSLTGAVAPVPDPDGVVGELVARVSGFGPLQPLPRRPGGRGDLDQRARAASSSRVAGDTS